MALNDLKKADELKQKHLEEYKRTRDALRIAANDPNVQILLRHMAKICGFFQSSLVVDPVSREVSTQSVIYNEGRRAVYLDLRRMMTDETRRIIESKGDDNAGRSDTGSTSSGDTTSSGNI